MTMDTKLASTSSASTPEAFVGPFKTAEEAEAVAYLLKHKTTQSDTSKAINVHQKVGGIQNLPMLAHISTNFNGNLQASTASSPQASATDTKKIIWQKPLSFLPTQTHENHQSSTNADVFKMQNNLLVSETSSPEVSSASNSSFLPISKENTIDAGNYEQKPVGNPTLCKAETDCISLIKAAPKSQKKSLPSITMVASLVFFDLETTGLAHDVGKSNVQITEVSMIAINRKEFEQSTFEDLRDIRIIQKLCLCTRPRSAVSSGAAAITGLNNENLSDQEPFEQNAAEAINFFLSHLPKPVCLLAHNGKSYDFPLLKAEFSRLSISLPPDILIADTLKAFRVLGVPVFPPEKKICKSVKYSKKGQVSYSLANLHLYFFNKKPTGSHSSEGDCIALAKVCHRMKDLMLAWIDENCTTFNSVSPMW